MRCCQGENLATIYDRLGTPSSKKEIEMDTYEYIVNRGDDASKLEGTLNLVGQEGFKLVWMKLTGVADTSFIAVFERKKASNSKTII